MKNQSVAGPTIFACLCLSLGFGSPALPRTHSQNPAPSQKGTFILQHTGTMNRGALQLSITVVPDSATGQLTGLTGTMNIQIADGKHSYDFAYFLPDSP